MRKPLIRGVRFVTAVVVVTLGLVAQADTFTLQIKRLESAGGLDYLFRGFSAQSYYRQTGLNQPTPPGQNDEAEFAKIVTKEPDKYHSKSPFRGVAKLGTQQFAFVLDSREAPAQPEQSQGERKEPAQPFPGGRQAPPVERYGRLLFDLNGNGDLTDDPVIDAQPAPAGAFPGGYAPFSFPRVDLTLNVEGTAVEYAFTLSGYTNTQYVNQDQVFQYASVSLSAAAYREGEIELDGQKLRVVVTDFNSNGRFDDLSTVDLSVRTSGGALYPQLGDMVFVDPQQPTTPYASGYDPTMSDSQTPLAKTMHIGDRFYDISITPAGDQLTITPSTAAVGYVVNPNKGYRALVYNDQGVVKIQGDEAGRATLPVGSWKLLKYTIDQSETAAAAPSDATPSMLQALSQAVLGGRPNQPRITLVAAGATDKYPAVIVREGETTELPFGAPFTPKVSGEIVQGGSLSLGLELIGTGGEVCQNLVVNSGRPPAPTFTITDPAGEVVATGNFEYG